MHVVFQFINFIESVTKIKSDDHICNTNFEGNGILSHHINQQMCHYDFTQRWVCRV